jgi:hypothetical protein
MNDMAHRPRTAGHVTISTPRFRKDACHRRLLWSDEALSVMFLLSFRAAYQDSRCLVPRRRFPRQKGNGACQPAKTRTDRTDVQGDKNESEKIGGLEGQKKRPLEANPGVQTASTIYFSESG